MGQTAMGQTQTALEQSEVRAIVQGLRIAREQFREYVKAVRAVAQTGGNGIMNADAARALADHHAAQGDEVARLARLIESADTVTHTRTDDADPIAV